MMLSVALTLIIGSLLLFSVKALLSTNRKYFAITTVLSSSSFNEPRLPSEDSRTSIFRSLMGAATILATTQAARSAIALGLDEKTGLFELCPATLLPSCTSSQDDRPAYFLPPWSYDGSYSNIKRRIMDYIEKGFPANGRLVSNSDRYLRYEFRDSQTSTIDDMELYFTPEDSTVQFRSCRRGASIVSDFGVNGNRVEKIRIGLGLESIPILRNRRRKFIFGESPFDEFGPPTILYESAVDSISSDMATKRGVGVFGDSDPKAPVFSTPNAQVYDRVRQK